MSKAILDRADCLLNKLLDHDLQFGSQTGAAQIVDDLMAELRRLADIEHEHRALLATEQNLREERTAWRVTAENAEAAVKQAREDALEEAMKDCEAISVDRWSLYKGRAPYTGQEPGRADPDTQGQSDGADACAAAIESMKGKT